MTNNKQQTAVDFIFDELASKNLLGIFTYEQFKQVEEILNQAKEMEEGAIIVSWHKGYDNQSPMIDENNCGQQYYNKTYRGNK
jgi:hypothetical protein